MKSTELIERCIAYPVVAILIPGCIAIAVAVWLYVAGGILVDVVING